MEEFEDNGYDTPKEAARGDIPRQFVRVLGVERDGDTTRGSLLTNEAPRFEPYQVGCERRDGRWSQTGVPGTFRQGLPIRSRKRRAGRAGEAGSTLT